MCDHVRRLYSAIISKGYDFKSGYWAHENATLEEIIRWNQAKLEQGFKLGFTQHVKHDYMQIIFDSRYSELRGFWTFSPEQIEFDLIIPERDVLKYSNDSIVSDPGAALEIIKHDRDFIYFKENEIMPMMELSKSIWQENLVDVIQTSIEFDGGCFGLEKILLGNELSINPFAIIDKSVFTRFPSDYFSGYKISGIGDNGVFLSNELHRKQSI